MSKIVFDTNIYVFALGWNGSILNLVEHCFKNTRYKIYTSKDILRELKLTLSENKIQSLSHLKIPKSVLNSFFISIVDRRSQQSR
jgi:putative PIN family toxin of toxin-antitoxin system